MLSLQSEVSTVSMGKCSTATPAYALGIRESKNYKGSEIQCLRALRLRFLTHGGLYDVVWESAD